MKANQVRIVLVSVAVKAEDAERVAQELSDVSSNYGFFSMGSEIRNPNRVEWHIIRQSDALPDEQVRRDEKHGLYGGKEDVAN